MYTMQHALCYSAWCVSVQINDKVPCPPVQLFEKHRFIPRNNICTRTPILILILHIILVLLLCHAMPCRTMLRIHVYARLGCAWTCVVVGIWYCAYSDSALHVDDNWMVVLFRVGLSRMLAHVVSHNDRALSTTSCMPCSNMTHMNTWRIWPGKPLATLHCVFYDTVHDTIWYDAIRYDLHIETISYTMRHDRIG